MSYPPTPTFTFTTIDQSEDTIPCICPIPIQFPLYAYFLTDFDIKLAVFCEYFIFPCNTFCFWINFLDSNQEKNYFGTRSSKFSYLLKFLQNTKEFLTANRTLIFFNLYLFFPLYFRILHLPNFTFPVNHDYKHLGPNREIRPEDIAPKLHNINVCVKVRIKCRECFFQ